MNLLEAKSITLRSYLKVTSGTLHIPFNQRPYEWGTDQAKRLFNDLYSVHTNPQKNHLLNFITVYEEDSNKKFIYDGQQRTVSVILIICSLIKKLREIGSDTLANDITKDFILYKDWSDPEETYKIIFEKETTNEFFRKYIASGIEVPNGITLSDYEKRLKINYELFEEWFNEKFETQPTEVEIKILMKNIIDNVMLILLETSDEDIATKMFDTLNSTGLQLVDFFVLKNTMVRALGEEVVKGTWETIESNTDGLSKKKFLSTYVNATNGKTPDSNLYDKILSNKDLDNPEQAKLLLKELKISSKTFLSLDSPTQKTDGNKKEQLEFVEHVNTLQITQAVQYKPVIIAMEIRNYPLAAVNSVLEAIIKLQFRNSFIGQEPGNKLEQFYPALAKQIYIEAIVTLDDILLKINRMMIDDQTVLDRFQIKQIKKSDEKILRHILRKIYNYQNDELIINPDTMRITVEHILPQNPEIGSVWLKNFTDDIRNKYTYSIGNITLLLGTLNSSAKNKDFSEKVAHYNQSLIPQNNKIALLANWTYAEVDQRTKELYDQFIVIWNKTV